ncbi:MAG TPA: oligosaccharide flippase family protein [Gaiellaceae bacterium]|nr:oligosaccharide flippase family protein [Gaiellaceae bacterium]
MGPRFPDGTLAFWRPFGASFATSVLIWSTGILTGLLLARALGPAGRGTLAAVMLWPATYSTLGVFGLGDAVTYHIVRGPERVRQVVASGLAVAAVLSVLLLAVGMALTPLVLHRYEGRAVFWGLVAMTQIPLTLVSQLGSATLNGLHRYGRFQLSRAAFVVVSAGGVVVLAASGHLSVGSAVCTYVAANVVATGVIAELVRREGALGGRPSRETTKELLSYGFKSHVAILSSALNQRLDQLVISLVLAPRQLGLYVVAVAFAGAVGMIGSSVGMVTLPQVGRVAAPDERRARVRRLVVGTVVLSVGAGAAFALVAHPLIVLAFGSSFAGAVTPARILLLAGVFLGANAVLSNVLRGVGRPLQAGMAELGALLVTVAALGALLPILGINGAAVASVLAYAATTTWMVRQARRAL